MTRLLLMTLIALLTLDGMGIPAPITLLVTASLVFTMTARHRDQTNEKRSDRHKND